MCPVVHLAESLGGGRGQGQGLALPPQPVLTLSEKGSGGCRLSDTHLLYACPSILLDTNEPLDSAQVKEIADLSSAAARVSVSSSQLQQFGLAKSFDFDANPTIVSASIVPISFVVLQVSKQFWCMRTACFQM